MLERVEKQYQDIPEYLLKVCRNFTINNKNIESPNKFFEVIDATERVKGIIVKVANKYFFLDISKTLNDEDVKNYLDEFYNSELNIKNGFLLSNGKRISQIGAEIAEENYAAQAQLDIEKELSPNLNLIKIKDEGTAEKVNWRFSMIDFTSKVFPKGPPENTVVAFFPGASSHEISLWNSFGFSIEDMVLIEGDTQKVKEIEKVFSLDKKPNFVNSWFGKGEDFVDNLYAQIRGRTVSVLSFDTESAFSYKLYDELVHVFESVHIENNLMFSLNLVARASEQICLEFLIQAEKRHGYKYYNGNSARKDLMKYLPLILIKDSNREDLTVENLESGQYFGNNAVTMEYVFSDIKKK